MRFLPPSGAPGASGLKSSTSVGLPASPEIVRVDEPLVAPAPPALVLVSPEQALVPAAVSTATAHTSADVLYLRVVIVRSFHRARGGAGARPRRERRCCVSSLFSLVGAGPCLLYTSPSPRDR